MVRTYSQRMLNPYHGMVNVVEISGADAVSRDGVNWMLYIQGGSETESLSDGKIHEISLPDIKFGSWSAEQGLRRAPVRFVSDYARLDEIGNQLLQSVKSTAEGVPFPQHDAYELWLLDRKAHLPLALLDSCCMESGADAFASLSWNPGQLARRTFRSLGCNSGESHADYLAETINGAAGRAPTVQWFARDADGSGLGMRCNNGRSGLAGRRLEAQYFPELMLRTDWENTGECCLAADFIAWQAPWLLALQNLSHRCRRRLEALARRRANLLAELYPTYPEVVDRKTVEAARVEAILRKSAIRPDKATETSETTFFVTGN